MTPEEFINKLNTAVEKTAEDMLPTMQEAALTGKALVARRVQNEGFGKKYRSRGYILLRALRGFEIRFVNLTFTGAMFRGWKIPGTYRIGLKVGGSVAGTDMETKNKLRWNKSRFPNFDKTNEEEETLLREKLIEPRLMESLRRNLFGA